MDPTEAFGELSRIKLGETDVDGTLGTIAGLAKRTIPGTAEVSVTLVRDRDPYTAAFTGELAVSLDESQYAQGHGPCLDASASAATLSLPDMTDEPRWPHFAERALASGCLSSLSIGLPLHDTVTGALNVYAGAPDAFDDDAITLAQTFAGYAAVALANAHVFEVQAALAQQLQATMRGRAVIEQAKGIVMGQRRCGPDEAYTVLARASHDSGRTLHEVAVSVVDRAAGHR
jgi:GAF domain-containing protein